MRTVGGGGKAESLPCMWENWIEFLAPGFSPGQALTVAVIWEMAQQMEAHCVSL